jgi:hypothetical protein
MALSELESYRSIYEAIRSFAFSLLTRLSSDGIPPVGLADLQPGFDQLQQHLQQALKLDMWGLEPAIAAQIAALHTEMAKQLRLLSMDMMFLQTARQPETVQRRMAQMGDRLRLLVRYCEAVLGEEA